MKNKLLIIISGPTGTGKTRLAVHLAVNRGEIISADSMQVYRYLDIGTAKPDKEQLLQVPHHLLSITDPDQDYNAFHFVNDAEKIIPELYKKKKVPFITGGTGLYIRSLLFGLSLAPGRDDLIRKELETRRDREGLGSLYQELMLHDKKYAEKINPHDSTRIIRALEVFLASHQPYSQFLAEHKKVLKYNVLWLGLRRERDELYSLIDQRTKEMFEHGLIEETRDLLAKGYSPEILGKRGIGYKEVIEYLNKKVSLEQALQLVQQKTRNYAKRQMTWFRKEKLIQWFHPDDIKSIETCINDWLEQNKFD